MYFNINKINKINKYKKMATEEGIFKVRKQDNKYIL